MLSQVTVPTKHLQVTGPCLLNLPVVIDTTPATRGFSLLSTVFVDVVNGQELVSFFRAAGALPPIISQHFFPHAPIVLTMIRRMFSPALVTLPTSILVWFSTNRTETFSNTLLAPLAFIGGMFLCIYHTFSMVHPFPKSQGRLAS